jgi:hypothetical protein
MSAAAETTAQCPATSEEAIAQLFDRWNASLATGRPGEVVKLYADNAVLVPALSDRPLMGREFPRSASAGLSHDALDHDKLQYRL